MASFALRNNSSKRLLAVYPRLLKRSQVSSPLPSSGLLSSHETSVSPILGWRSMATATFTQTRKESLASSPLPCSFSPVFPIREWRSRMESPFVRCMTVVAPPPPPNESATPKSEKSATPKSEKSATPESEKSATPESEKSATPEANESTTPEANESDVTLFTPPPTGVVTTPPPGSLDAPPQPVVRSRWLKLAGFCIYVLASSSFITLALFFYSQRTGQITEKKILDSFKKVHEVLENVKNVVAQGIVQIVQELRNVVLQIVEEIVHVVEVHKGEILTTVRQELDKLRDEIKHEVCLEKAECHREVMDMLKGEVRLSREAESAALKEAGAAKEELAALKASSWLARLLWR